MTEKVQVLSIPRDMRVEIPGHGFSKINDAYRFGDVDLTLETVKDFLGVPHGLLHPGEARRRSAVRGRDRGDHA